ncbi:hypothetical protein IFR04_007486 [Cadophora malorum]|uniref:DUF7924 domain-containing protein n=1 Tax=Cadophora malorum TaxID=108018 RepID=A0A8H7WAE0_9HELO|nr:hypothetical protein IFR04_007486 [Cadophora malorum]
MAPRQAKRNIQKVGRQRSAPKGEKARPQGIKKEQPPSRKSARLQRHQERTVSKYTNTEPKRPRPSPTSNTPGKEFPQAEDRKRKRERSKEDEAPLPATPSQKRPRTSPRSPLKDTISENAAVGGSGKEINPIEYWRKEGTWPEEYFNPEGNMSHLLARKKSLSSLRAKQSEAGSTTPSSTTPSDQKPREAKSSPYARPSYETVLATKGSFLDKCDNGIEKAGRDLCQNLLYSEQTYPQNSLFRNDLFDTTCRKIRNRNETMVIRDISLLIVPSAQTLATYGATHLDLLIESVNEGWNSAIPFYGPRPQPDYSVGFGRSAFTNDQLEKLKPFVGEVTDTFTSHFMATWQMYFPFLTCEVKCGAAALDVADRQNAHSMTLAVRGVVELFRLVKREKELHREILAFSISHDHSTVRIYGHYALIDGSKTAFYRHPIKKFDFTSEEGKDKWTSYQFTKNVYDIWMPTHLKRICSVIDKLPPDPDFEVSQQSEPGESGLSQGLESHHLSDQSSQVATSLLEDTDSQPSHVATSLLEDADSQPSRVASRDITSDTSVSQRIEERAFKKPKKRGRAAELQQ